MTKIYTITISDNRTGIALATATVELDASGARLTSIRAEASGDERIPEAMADFDFPLLVHIAGMLAGSAGGPGATPSTPACSTEAEPIQAAPPVDGATATPRAPIHDESVRTPTLRPQRSSAPADFAVNYWRLGSIAKVARHYDIPHHIAREWIESLQQQGKLGNPWPARNRRSQQSR
ncbi:hypothetical protein AB0346_10715 [Nocardia beijingensis]|uniref:hypothetical protein n=1 Tax=Nocardia beijingensis TaxID=95162 RepID=UPI00344E2FDC